MPDQQAGAGAARADSASGAPSLHFSQTNVLWLTLCTLRPDHLGAYGYPHSTSPAIDALAKGGVLFERVLVSAPWTRPSIASSITGSCSRMMGFLRPTPAGKLTKLPTSFRTVAEYLKEHGYCTIGITTNPNTNSSFGFEQGFDYYQNAKVVKTEKGYAPVKLSAGFVRESLLKLLRGPARGRKFFAHLTFTDTHQPYDDGVALRRLGAEARTVGDARTRRYDCQIRYLDAEIADLLGSLDLQNTLVIVTTDHGEGFAQANPDDIGHGPIVYNSTIWAACILSHPALAFAKQRYREEVELIDVMPTVMDLLGIDLHTQSICGRSLKGLIDSTADLPARPFHVVETRYSGGRAVRVNRSALLWNGWKLITTYAPSQTDRREEGTPSFELYRYMLDPHDARDQSADHPETVQQMFAVLSKWQREHKSEPNPDSLADPDPDLRGALRALGYAR